MVAPRTPKKEKGGGEGGGPKRAALQKWTTQIASIVEVKTLKKGAGSLIKERGTRYR